MTSQCLFTKHARERMHLRSISESAVASVLESPGHTIPGKKDGSVKFVRVINGREIQVVANYLKDQYKWLVISVWVRGENDPTPLAWQLITLPFRAIWWLCRRIFRHLKAKHVL